MRNFTIFNYPFKDSLYRFFAFLKIAVHAGEFVHFGTAFQRFLCCVSTPV